MPDEQIEQWANVLFSERCSYRLALMLGFGGEDLSRPQFINLMRYLRDHEPSAAGFEQCVEGMVNE
jgi:hypothetical protein